MVNFLKIGIFCKYNQIFPNDKPFLLMSMPEKVVNLRIAASGRRTARRCPAFYITSTHYPQLTPHEKDFLHIHGLSGPDFTPARRAGTRRGGSQNSLRIGNPRFRQRQGQGRPGVIRLPLNQTSNGGCGCTRPEFPKKPIAPGESGTITIHFNPATFRGEIKRQVTVKTNAGRKKLKFGGVIVP